MYSRNLQKFRYILGKVDLAEETQAHTWDTYLGILNTIIPC